MSKFGAPEKLIVNGERLDGRGLKDFRPIELDAGNLKRALGSGLFNFGTTHAIAAVYGPRNLHPKWMQDPSRAVLRCTYTMAPFSTTERSRPGHSRRSTEISKVIKEALSQVIFFEEFPKAVIDVFIEIVQANASTRCAGLNAAAMALADAGIPMRDLVSCCSVGKIDGKIALDMAGLEDNFGDVDIAVATVGGTDKVVLLQLDGILSKEEFFEALDLAVDGCSKINDMQKKVLLEKYRGEEK